MSVSQIAALLDDVDRAILMAFANNGMSVKPTAEKTYYDRRTVSNRLTSIRLATGIDPRDFWGLHRLLSIIEAEKEEERRGKNHP